MCVSAPVGHSVRLSNGSFSVASLEALTPIVLEGTLSLNDAGQPSAASTFTFNHGVLTGPGTLTVNAAMTWNSGTMSGAGQTVIASGATLTAATSGDKRLNGRTFHNDGVAATTGTGAFLFAAGTVVENTGVWTLATDSPFYNQTTATSEIVNTGVLRKTGGSETSIGVPITNNGTLVADVGRFDLQGGGGSSSGTYAGVTMANANYALAGGAQLGAGVRFSGMVSIDGPVTVASGGVLDLNGGDIRGAGTLTVDGAMNWAGGIQYGSGSTVIASTGTLTTVGDGNLIFGGRTLHNDGTVHGSGNAQILFNHGTRVENAGLWTLESGARWLPTTAETSEFVNTGEFRKTAGAENDISVPFTNNGVIVANVSRINLQNGGGSSGGSFSGVNLSIGSFALSSGAEIGANVNVGGTVSIDGPVTVKPGGALNLFGGDIRGAGTLTVDGAMNWSGGSQYGPGSTVIASTGSLTTVGDGNLIFAGRTLHNDGTVHGGGNAQILFNHGTRVENAGLWTLESGARWVNNTLETSEFVNTGEFHKTAGAENDFGVPFTNNGVVAADVSRINLQSGGGSSSGTFSGVSLAIGSFPLSGGAQIGANVRVGGTVTVNGPVSVVPGGVLDLSGGTINGAGTLTVDGNLTWSSGRQYGPGSTVISPGGTMTATALGDMIFAGRTFHNDGTVDVTGGGQFLFNYGTVVENAGLWKLGTDSRWYNNTVETSKLANSGELRKTGGAETTIDIPVHNTGTIAGGPAGIRVQAGGIGGSGSLYSGVKFNGLNYALNGGSHIGAGVTVSNTVNIDGPVTVDFGGSLALGSELRGSGTLTVNGTLNWVAGFLNGDGVTSIAAGGQLLIPANGNGRQMGDQHKLNNAGTITWGGDGLYWRDGTTLTNSGTFEISGDYPTLNDWSTSVRPLIVNTGTVRRVAGTGQVDLAADLDNQGTLRIDSGSARITGNLLSYASATRKLNGGSYVLSGPLRVPGIDILQIQSVVVLDGPAAAIVDDSNQNALRNTNRIASGARLEVRNGASASMAPVFNNNGTLVVTDTTNVAFGTSFTQYAGSDTRLETSAARLTAPSISVQGGTVTGRGVLAGNVANTAGIVRFVGATPATLQVTGTYSQAAGGTLRTRVDSGGQDALAVTGAATLNGTLDIVPATGFLPAVSTAYPLLTFASSSGTFATVNGRTLSNGDVLWISRTSSVLSATVRAAGALPVGTVLINGGAASTASTASTLTLAGPAGGTATSMRIANNVDPTAAFAAFAATKAWALPSTDGTHQVRVQFRDSEGNVSGVTTASIVLDRTAPVATITSPTTTTGAVTFAFNENVTGVNTGSIVLRSGSSTTNLAGTLVCKTSTGTTVACTSGTVRSVVLTPTSALTAGVAYTASVNPTSATTRVTDALGNTSAVTSAGFTL